MPIRVNQTSSKVWQDRCGLLLDGLPASGTGGLPGAGGNAALWARATKNVKKPPDEKRRTFRKPKNTFGPQVTFLIL